MEQENRILRIDRIFNVSLAALWDAWTKAEHLSNWWGHQGAKTQINLLDFKTGGRWEFAMPGPDGSVFISEGEYKELVTKKRIVTSADFKPMTENVVITIEFNSDDDKSGFSFNVLHETDEYCRQQESFGFMMGWGAIFDQLEKYISK